MSDRRFCVSQLRLKDFGADHARVPGISFRESNRLLSMGLRVFGSEVDSTASTHRVDVAKRAGCCTAGDFVIALLGFVLCSDVRR